MRVYRHIVIDHQHNIDEFIVLSQINETYSLVLSLNKNISKHPFFVLFNYIVQYGTYFFDDPDDEKFAIYINKEFAKLKDTINQPVNICYNYTSRKNIDRIIAKTSHYFYLYDLCLSCNVENIKV